MKFAKEKVEVFIVWTKRKIFHHFDDTEETKQKYSVDMCFILPLTTQVKSRFPRYQYKFILNDKINAANLSQGRTISSKRLMQKFGIVDAEVFKDIIQKFVVLLEE